MEGSWGESGKDLPQQQISGGAYECFSFLVFGVTAC